MIEKHRPRREEALADRAGEKIEWALDAIAKAELLLNNGDFAEFNRNLNHAKTLLRQALVLAEEASSKYSEPRFAEPTSL